jgi:hypothetical protein
MDPSCSPPEAGEASHPNGETPKPPACDVKQHLTEKDYIVLEQHFQLNQRPSTLVKMGYASTLDMPPYKIKVSNDPSLLPHACDMLT